MPEFFLCMVCMDIECRETVFFRFMFDIVIECCYPCNFMVFDMIRVVFCIVPQPPCKDGFGDVFFVIIDEENYFDMFFAFIACCKFWENVDTF